MAMFEQTFESCFSSLFFNSSLDHIEEGSMD